MLPPSIDRATSANRLRMVQEKLNQTSVQSRMENETAMRSIETRIEQIEQKINKSTTTDQQKFLVLADQLQKYFQAQQTEKAAREVLNERKSKEIELTVVSLQENMEKEQQTLMEISQRILNQLTDKQNALINDITKYSDEGNNIQATEFKFMQDQVGKVVLEIEANKKAFLEKFQDVALHLDHETIAIRQAIEKEQQECQNVEITFKETFKKVCQMLQQKLISEREEREAKENEIITLLEHVTIKVEEYKL